MAIMYPSRLSDSVRNEKMRKGEVDAYDALTALSNEFEIFYNRYTGKSHGASAYKRRIDFIVLHEKLGLLAIEVKGGKIRLGQDGTIEHYYPSTKEWTPIDPYGQVEKAVRALISDCKGDGVKHWIPADTCVLFPQTLRRDITDLPQKLPDGTLCAEDMPILAQQIPARFSKPSHGAAWRRDAFLDMRRRLQNMPEATWGNGNSNGKFKKEKREPFSPRQTVTQTYQETAGPPRIWASQPRAMQPSEKRPRTPSASVRKPKWEAWELIVAGIVSCFAVFYLSQLFLNAHFHKFW